MFKKVLFFQVVIFFALFGCAHAAVEYEIQDLGVDFIPVDINAEGAVLGNITINETFYGDASRVVIWEKEQGFMPVPETGEVASEGLSITDEGAIGGSVRTVDYHGVEFPCIWRSPFSDKKTTIRSFGEPARVTSLHDNGTVCGFSVVRSGGCHSFFLDHEGKLRDIHSDSLGYESEALAVNGQGIVVGKVLVHAGYYRAYIWQMDSSMRFLDGLGDGESVAMGLNERGDIIGWQVDSVRGARRAFLFNACDGLVVDLGTLGGSESVAKDVNDTGLVVGQADYVGLYESGPVGFLWRNGKMENLNKLVDRTNGWWVLEAIAINNQSVIIAKAYNENDEQVHAVVLTPISQRRIQIDEDQPPLKAIYFLLGDKGKNKYPQRQFVTIPAREINRLNNSGDHWCQPISYVDLNREGATQFDHYKIYKVILMYRNGESGSAGHTFTSFDTRKQNNEIKVTARPGDVLEVPGYFLNDWNFRVLNKTVLYWFQPLDVVPKELKGKLTHNARNAPALL